MNATLENVRARQTADSKAACPDCGGVEFKLGPQGGLSQNVECVGCETRWNATFIEGIPWQRLSAVWERLEQRHEVVT